MMSFSRLDTSLHTVNSQITIKNAERKQYNSMLMEVLQTYLLDVMEEDPLYDLLYQRMQYVGSSYENLKIRAPNAFDLNFVIVLGILPEDIKVEYSTNAPGHVQLILPDNLEETLQKSRVWRSACNKGLQHEMLRLLNSWKNSNNHLLQSSVQEWFGEVVDQAIQSSIVPNFVVKRLAHSSSVILEVHDTSKDNKFTITMQPVIAFPISQLPHEFAANIPSNICCDEWMVECRRDPNGRKELWGVSLWQQELVLMNDLQSMKPVIRLVKALRDAGSWNHLTSYVIKTLFMLEQKKWPRTFWQRSLGDLLMHMLLRVRDAMSSNAGIPFYWDTRCNLLTGLSGPQRMYLARAAEDVRLKLEASLTNPSVNVGGLFGVSIDVRPTRRSSSSPPPQVIQRGGLMQQENQGNSWLWALGGAVAVVGAAVAIGVAATRHNRNNN